MSTPELSRIRRGELVAGISGVLLLVSMFSLNWYAVSTPFRQTLATLGVKTSFNGWTALSHLRYLLLLTILAALALAYSQAAARPPAIPISLAVIVTTLGVLSVLALINRVLINPPGPGGFLDQQAGAYLGLLACIGIAYGGYASMREESGAQVAGEAIEIARVRSSAAGS